MMAFMNERSDGITSLRWPESLADSLGFEIRAELDLPLLTAIALGINGYRHKGRDNKLLLKINSDQSGCFYRLPTARDHGRTSANIYPGPRLNDDKRRRRSNPSSKTGGSSKRSRGSGKIVKLKGNRIPRKLSYISRTARI